MRGRSFAGCVALGSTILFATEASAGIITRSTSFVPGPATPVLLESFDPSLGSLDRVDLMLTGALVLHVQTPPNPIGPFGSPVLYSFTLQLGQGFSGQGSFDVAFAFDALYLSLTGISNGAQTLVTLPPIPFLISMSFTATTDLPGIAFPSATGPDVVPPVFGRREDFLSPVSGFSLPLLAEHRLTPAFIASSGPAVIPSIAPTGTANLILTYHFTPHASTPEPATSLLLGLGLLLVPSRARRRA